MVEFDFVKSSYSASGGECVEIAVNVPGAVAVRDSKDTAGPIVQVSPAAWAAFRSGVTGEP
ncbi:DUF397 domain-containing protein [Streptomyces sp. NBC_01023]|nr:DUF397 domain-containing protein [Streptomyces sp. NBC_01023]